MSVLLIRIKKDQMRCRDPAIPIPAGTAVWQEHPPKSLCCVAFELALQNTDQMLEAELFCGCGGLAGAGLGFQFSVSPNTNFVSAAAKTRLAIAGSVGGKLNWEFSGIAFVIPEGLLLRSVLSFNEVHLPDRKDFSDLLMVDKECVVFFFKGFFWGGLKCLFN